MERVKLERTQSPLTSPFFINNPEAFVSSSKVQTDKINVDQKAQEIFVREMGLFRLRSTTEDIVHIEYDRQGNIMQLNTSGMREPQNILHEKISAIVTSSHWVEIISADLKTKFKIFLTK